MYTVDTYLAARFLNLLNTYNQIDIKNSSNIK